MPQNTNDILCDSAGDHNLVRDVVFAFAVMGFLCVAVLRRTVDPVLLSDLHLTEFTLGLLFKLVACRQSKAPNDARHHRDGSDFDVIVDLFEVRKNL